MKRNIITIETETAAGVGPATTRGRGGARGEGGWGNVKIRKFRTRMDGK